MNLPVIQPQAQLPSCYGKEWDRNSPECAGGPDPNFVHPVTRQHLHEQCAFFHSCGTRQQATRQAQAPRPGTWQSPSPPTVPIIPTPSAPQTFQDYLRQQQALHVEAMRLQAMTGPRPPVMPPQMVPAPGAPVHPGYPAAPLQPGYPSVYAQYPAPAYQLNYMMPGYLSVPEERLAGEGLMPVLFREVFRSVFKAAGHSTAHFFDVRAIKPPQGK